MRHRLIILSAIILCACKSDTLPQNEDYVQLYDLPFEFPKNEAITTNVPGLADLRSIRLSSNIPRTRDTPENEKPAYFTAVISEDVTYQGNVENYLEGRECNHELKKRLEKQVDPSYDFSEISILKKSAEIDVYRATNECNFPGGFGIPQDPWQCGEIMTYPDDESFAEFCEIAIESEMVDPDSNIVINFPIFFEDDEYILRVKDKIFRVRKFKESTSRLGDNALKNMLINTRAL